MRGEGCDEVEDDLDFSDLCENVDWIHYSTIVERTRIRKNNPGEIRSDWEKKNENWIHHYNILRDDWQVIIAVLSLDPGKGVFALGPTTERCLVWICLPLAGTSQVQEGCALVSTAHG